MWGGERERKGERELSVYTCNSHFYPSSTDGHFGCFRNLATVRRCRELRVQIPFQGADFSYSEADLLVHMVVLVLNL